MAFDVGAIVGRLELQKDQWEQSIKKVKADQKSLSGLVMRNSAQFRKMGRTMTIAGTAIVGTVGLMVKAYGTFDHAMNESLAIMGDVSDKQKKAMAEVALDMSTKTVYAAKELAKGYFFLASAGMDVAQSIKALPVVAKFAQAGTFDLAVATDLLTDAQTALGLSSKNAEDNQRNLIEVSDVLVKANTLANASVLQFSEALTNKAAAALVNVNKEMYEGVAVLAAYADKGVKGQIAGSRLSMMLNSLDIASRKNRKAWEENGLALFDANEEMRSIGDIIGDLEVKLGDMTTKQKSATLAALGFNVRTKASILTLMGSSEKIKQWTEDLKDAGGITEEVAKKQMQSLVNQFIVLKNQIMKAAISVGETLGPALKNLIGDFKGIITKISDWIKWHPKLTEVIAKSAVAVGGLLMVLGPLMMMLPGLIAAGPMIGAAFTAMLGPIGLVIIALTALAGWTNHIINLSKKRTDAEIDAIVNTAKGHAKMWALRKKLIANEIVTVEEWGEIYKKHGKSHKRVMIAMAKAPEYAYIREELDKLKEKKEEVGKTDKDLTEILRENSEEVMELTSTMIDEVMRGTLKEYEYKIWTARKTYEERKALLEAEGADKEAFLLLERSLSVELEQIEKDKTQILQDKIKERTAMLQAAIDKGFEAEKMARDKILVLHAGYTNTIKELTLSEKDYKLWQLDEWYAGELEKLGTSLEAKAALEEAYGLKKKKINKDIAYSQISLFEKIGSAAIIALGQSKAGAVAQAVMSTYAGAAKTIEMLGMPWAIPFVAMAIAQGMKQVKRILAEPLPSRVALAKEGLYLPMTTLIEAGHGGRGEVILPLDKAPLGKALAEAGVGTGAEISQPTFYTTVNIYAKTLDDRTIERSGEKLLDVIQRKYERFGRKFNV